VDIGFVTFAPVSYLELITLALSCNVALRRYSEEMKQEYTHC
jgi:hypothetical protein